jgi:nucleotide-binding universal stress UspA family protein
MFLVVRPLLVRWLHRFEETHGPEQQVMAVIAISLLLSCLATEAIGIHALFGAFLMGAIMPKGTRFVRLITDRLEDLTVLFLLPIFFAYSGLQTRIGLLDTPYLWGVTGLIVLVACVGKFGGSAVAARLTGLSWRESSAIGILMNTRGLVELVSLTIGLRMGVINRVVFAMMVIMALVTTAMTSPILEWVFPKRFFEAPGTREPAEARDFKIVVPVSRPQSAPGLAHVAAMLGGADTQAMMMYGLYVHPPRLYDGLGLHSLAEQSGEQSSEPSALEPLRAEALRMKIPAQSLSLVSRDIASDIARVARDCSADLVLMGFHKAVIGETILGGTVHRVLTGTDADVAVFVDRGLSAAPSILVPYQGSTHDRLAVDLACRMAASPGVNVTILHVVPSQEAGAAGGSGPSIREEPFPDSVQIWLVDDDAPLDAVLRQSVDFNLIVIGLAEEWGLTSHLFGFRAERIARESRSSLLLVRKHLPMAPVHEQLKSPPTAEPAIRSEEGAVQA